MIFRSINFSWQHYDQSLWLFSWGECFFKTLGPLGFGKIYQEDVNPDMSCGTQRLLIFIKSFLFSMRISWFMAMVQPSGHLNWKIWYGTDNCDQESHLYT